MFGDDMEFVFAVQGRLAIHSIHRTLAAAEAIADKLIADGFTVYITSYVLED
jgi:hypothetical protein